MLRSYFREIYFAFILCVYPENTMCSSTKYHQGRWNEMFILYSVTNNPYSKYKQMTQTGLNGKIDF